MDPLSVHADGVVIRASRRKELNEKAMSRGTQPLSHELGGAVDRGDDLVTRAFLNVGRASALADQFLDLGDV